MMDFSFFKYPVSEEWLNKYRGKYWEIPNKCGGYIPIRRDSLSDVNIEALFAEMETIEYLKKQGIKLKLLSDYLLEKLKEFSLSREDNSLRIEEVFNSFCGALGKTDYIIKQNNLIINKLNGDDA